MFRVEETADVPHFASKFAAERMIAKYNMPVTILRPNAYMQSPGVKDAIGHGVFPFPIGQKGVSFTDVRDIAEVAVLEIQRRVAAKEALGPEIYEVVAEDVLTGETGAKLWSGVLGRPIKYVGDDLDQYVQSLRAFAPNWMAYDFKYMMKHFQKTAPHRPTPKSSVCANAWAAARAPTTTSSWRAPSCGARRPTNPDGSWAVGTATAQMHESVYPPRES